MRVQFELPDCAGTYLVMAARRLGLRTRQAKGPASDTDDIARALLLEVLADDADAHGLLCGSERPS